MNTSKLKINQGFTLIELLVVVAIMVVLAGTVIIFTGGSKAKAQLATFKSETRGSYAGLSVQCVSGAALTPPADTAVTNWAASFSSNCSSSGKFTITAIPVSTTIDCTATVTETGVAYSGTGCN